MLSVLSRRAEALFLVVIVFLRLLKRRRARASAIPTLGYGTMPILGPWIGMARFMADPEKFIKDGYELHKDQDGPGGCFRFSDFFDEIVVICNESKILEALHAPVDVLSSLERAKETIQVKWVLGPQIHNNIGYPMNWIRNRSTQDMNAHMPASQCEIQAGFHRALGDCAGQFPTMHIVQLLTLTLFQSGRTSRSLTSALVS
jgi:hypothetical protein